MITRLNHKQYVFAFFGVSVFIAVLTFLTGLILFDAGNLAAPPVTGRVSFDEKLMFFHNNTLPERVDVFAIGSSMTLNNLSSSVMVEATGENYRNFSSWGLLVKQMSYLVRFLADRYNPEVIINVTGPMDFYRSAVHADFFGANEVGGYLDGNDLFYLYLKYFDPLYLAKSSGYSKRRRSGNDMYDSVRFDYWGGVSLDIAKVNIDRERWERRIDPSRFDPDAYESLRELAEFLDKKNIQFVMVQPPVRAIAIEDNMESVKKHWKMIEEISREHSFLFVNLYEQQGITDKRFIDSTHLNYEGANIFTGQFIKSSQGAIKAALQ